MRTSRTSSFDRRGAFLGSGFWVLGSGFADIRVRDYTVPAVLERSDVPTRSPEPRTQKGLKQRGLKQRGLKLSSQILIIGEQRVKINAFFPLFTT